MAPPTTTRSKAQRAGALSAPPTKQARTSVSGGSTSGGSSGSAASAASSGQDSTAPQRVSDASSAQPQQVKKASYAQATATGDKRKEAPATVSTRPPLVRGDPTFQVKDWESLARLAPTTLDPLVLYVDLRHTDLSAREVLVLAHETTQRSAVGFQHFAAQKALSLSFNSIDHVQRFVGQPIGDTDLVFYQAPPSAVHLQRLTVQGCPTASPNLVSLRLKQIFATYGTVVAVVPMVQSDTGLHSDTWQVTIRVDAADSPLPPARIKLLEDDDLLVTVNVPGQRRFCHFCQSEEHVRFDCRQGQRARVAANKLKQQEAAFNAARAQAAAAQTADSQSDDPQPKDPVAPPPPKTPPPRSKSPVSSKSASSKPNNNMDVDVDAETIAAQQSLALYNQSAIGGNNQYSSLDPALLAGIPVQGSGGAQSGI